MRTVNLGFYLGADAKGAARADEPKKDAPHLRFLVLASEPADGPAVQAAVKFFKDAARNDKAKADLLARAKKGQPPPQVKVVAAEGDRVYSWVEVGPAELRSQRVAVQEEEERGEQADRQVEERARDRARGLSGVALKDDSDQRLIDG